MTRVLNYTAVGTEGSSFTVAGLSGKSVLAILRAGQYRRVIVGTPSAADEIKVTGTDQGSGLGILSSDGSVALQTGDGLLLNEKLDFIYED